MPTKKAKRHKRRKKSCAKKSGGPWGIDPVKYAAARSKK